MSSDETSSRAGSQFEPLTFEASAAPGAAACHKCGTVLRGSYHMINERMSCGPCRFAAEEQLGGGTGLGGLARATVFGAGAAVLGAAGYYAFVKLTNVEWALLTALVGLGVGMAVRVGSRGHGGRKFQVVALALTYLAMSGAYLPLIVAELTTGPETVAITPGVLLTWLVKTPIFVGLASPISGLFIAYALYRGWKSNAAGIPLAVSGPFRLQDAAGRGTA
ncbi:MAG TPA: hypothetical protein VG432_09750 [Gemmatimonadaceae bacterium]|nr:hypothetical protein [Gemmatimonadaceae bacterium]